MHGYLSDEIASGLEESAVHESQSKLKRRTQQAECVQNESIKGPRPCSLPSRDRQIEC